MKKLLFLLLAAAAVTACDNDEERNGKQSAVYDGTLIVTDKTQTPHTETSSKNVRYELAESNDGTITLTAGNQVRKQHARPDDRHPQTGVRQ
ncbi:MAG: hypothetical protein LUH46_12750 [Alistipes sp.]|nr:hypothetical protein [Alistipes sp.]